MSRQDVASLPAGAKRLGLFDRWFRSLVLGNLRTIRHGRVEVRDENDARVFGAAEDRSTQPDATVRVHDARFYRQVALGGALGAAESYARGFWSCDDLTGLLRVFVRDIAKREASSIVTPRLVEPAQRVLHSLRRNTRRGSRRNIHDHYDLGNEFFALFLDDTMTYSCGVFESPDSTLREASVAKIDRICRKLDLRPDHHIVEIGSGWGSFALHAASQYGCRVTTTTVSEEQLREARKRVSEAGLDDRIEVLLCDYRDLTGSFDRLVSIEMIEAVGHDHLDEYFATCDRLLESDGIAVIQAITMPDRDHDAYLRSVDFIQKYIFPGSCLPSLESMTRAVKRSTRLRFEHIEDIGLHYARTLRLWREAFDGSRATLLASGRTEHFFRLWQYYFSYCEAGFMEKYLGDLQVVLAKPDARVDVASWSKVAEAPA